jgi:protein phosphatase
MVADEQLAAILMTTGGLQGKCCALVDAANGHGGRDNISVILMLARAKQVRRGLLSRMLGSGSS